jgi:hypothetical protein
MCIFALAFGKQIAMTDALHRWATATSALSSNPRGSRMDTRNTYAKKNEKIDVLEILDTLETLKILIIKPKF